MEINNKQSAPKGRRPNKIKSLTVTFKLREDVFELINQNFPNRSGFIKQAIREKLRRECLI